MPLFAPLICSHSLVEASADTAVRWSAQRRSVQVQLYYNTVAGRFRPAFCCMFFILMRVLQIFITAEQIDLTPHRATKIQSISSSANLYPNQYDYLQMELNSLAPNSIARRLMHPVLYSHIILGNLQQQCNLRGSKALIVDCSNNENTAVLQLLLFVIVVSLSYEFVLANVQQLQLVHLDT